MMKFVLFCLFGAALGFIAWNGPVYGLAALPFLVVLWGRSRTRIEAFGSVYAYYLAAASCQLSSISTYWMPVSGQPATKEALLVWFGANAMLASIWALFWGRSWLSIRLIVILGLISLPPIGVIGWASPLTGAGIWFPWMGWYGLALFIALAALLVAPAGHGRNVAISIVIAGALMANLAFPSPPSAGGVGIDTNFGDARDFAGEYDRLIEVDDRIRNTLRAGRPEYILLPEAVGGFWSSSQILFDQVDRAAARRRVTVLIGAREFDGAGQLVNAVYSIGAGAGHRWINRVPVPAGLWRPGETGSAATDWWSAGVNTVNGRKIGSVICYEQLLVWPVLFSAAAGAEMLIAPSNIWFGVGTSLPSIQRDATTSWARLFGMPVIFAGNR